MLRGSNPPFGTIAPMAQLAVAAGSNPAYPGSNPGRGTLSAMTSSASYTLADDPSPLPATAIASGSEVLPNAAPLTVARGLLLPFQRNLRSDFANGTGSELWIARVKLLLSVRGPTERGVGEIAWRPEEGAPLHILRHQNNTPMLREMARHYIVGAFRRSLPGVLLSSLETPLLEKNKLTVRITFRVVQANVAVERGLEAVAEIPVTLQG